MKNYYYADDSAPLLPKGTILHAIAWWDTESGVVTRREDMMLAGEVLRLRLPALAADVAAQITPLPVTGR